MDTPTEITTFGTTEIDKAAALVARGHAIARTEYLLGRNTTFFFALDAANDAGLYHGAGLLVDAYAMAMAQRRLRAMIREDRHALLGVPGVGAVGQ